MAVTSLGRKSYGILLLALLISLIKSQELIFELKDRQFQEIIFSGDVTVAMICKMTNVMTAEVAINIDGRTAASNNGEGNCLEFVISRIDSTDNVNLTCSVSYSSGGNIPEVTETKTLILNVSERDHSCFRNGTGSNQPYKVGDVLLLSCYCRLTEPCIWTETVVGTELGSVVQTFEERVYNNKKIRRIMVGPFNDTNGPAGDTYINTLRYDCSHGSTSEKRCSVGPVGTSASDFILNPTTPSETSLKCSVREVFISNTTIPSSISEESSTAPSISEESNTAYSMMTTSMHVPGTNTIGSTTEEDGNGNNNDFLLIIVGVGILLLLVILIISFLILVKRKRKENESKERQEEDSSDLNGNKHVFVEGATAENSDQFQNGHISDNGFSGANVTHQDVDNQGYVGTVADDYSALFLKGQVTDDGVCVANVTDNRDVDNYFGREVHVPVNNDGYGHDDDDDQFYTADTSDYVPSVAMMKSNILMELAEDAALYAQVNKRNSSNEHTQDIG